MSGNPFYRSRGLLRRFRRFQPNDHVVLKQRADRYRIKPRGQLSGAIAKTTAGEAINELHVEPIVVTANHTSGHRGPWFL